MPVPPASIATSAQDHASELDDTLSGVENLDLEADYRKLLNAEIQQRMTIKQIVLYSAISVMGIMGCILFSVFYLVINNYLVNAPSTVIIALCLSPIISITTITIMLLIGAFRRFKDDDLDKVTVSDISKMISKP